MNQVVQMPLSFFIEEDSNGNIAMPNLIKKVDEASKLLTPGVVIELDNGVRCSTRDELLLAVSQAKSISKDAVNRYPTPQTESTGKKISFSNVAKWTMYVVILIFVIIVLAFMTGGGF